MMFKFRANIYKSDFWNKSWNNLIYLPDLPCKMPIKLLFSAGLMPEIKF